MTALSSEQRELDPKDPRDMKGKDRKEKAS